MKEIGVLLLASVFVLHVFLLGKAELARTTLPSAAGTGFVLPAPILRITSLEFKGLVSDILFLKALVFEGSTYERGPEAKVEKEEWQWFYQILKKSTDLDPYFFDPYYFANAHLTWKAGMVQESNDLLEKGARYRTWDWMPPFYIGFNDFFFIKDNDKAAQWLMTASQRPGASEQLASIAARLEYKEKKTENAILFLEAIAKRTDDERTKKEYLTRIRALRARFVLEKAVTSYKLRFRTKPRSLNQLVEKGIIKELPKDPYCGQFVINSNGEITASTDYLLMPGLH